MADTRTNGGAFERGPALRLVASNNSFDRRRLVQAGHQATKPLLEDIERHLEQLKAESGPDARVVIAQCRETIEEVRSLMSVFDLDQSA